MQVERQEIDGVPVISVAAALEIDLGNAEEFKHSVLDATGEDAVAILDATLVEYFDSAGMGALLFVQKRLAERNGRLHLAGLNQAIQEIFRMVGFDVVFHVHPDVPQAVVAVKDEGAG